MDFDFSWLSDELNALWEAIAGFFIAILSGIIETLYNVLTDVFLWIFDAILTMAESVLSSLNFDFPSIQPYLIELPDEVVNIMKLVGVPECLVILTTALTIRFTLGLVPFINLGR